MGILGILGVIISNFILKYSSIFAGQKDYDTNYKFYEAIFKTICIYSIIPFCFFVVMTPFLYQQFKLSDPIGLIILSIAAYFSLISLIPSGILTGWQFFFATQTTGLVVAFLKLVMGYGIAYFYPRASIVILSYALPGILGLLLLFYFFKKKFPKIQGDNKEDWKYKYFSKDYFRKSLLPIFFFSAFVVILNNQDVLLVKYFTSSENTGFFSAFNLLGKVIFWVNGAVIGVILPIAISESHNHGKVNPKIIWGTYFFLILSSSIATLIYYLFPELIVSLLFGSKYNHEANVLYLFGILGFLFSIFTLEFNLAFARHNFQITYILILVAFMEGIFIYNFHNSIHQIAYSLLGSLAIGYIGSVLVNFMFKRKNIDRDVLMQTPNR